MHVEPLDYLGSTYFCTSAIVFSHSPHNLCRVVDLLVHMNDEGLLPDNPMLSSVAKAVAKAHCRISATDDSATTTGQPTAANQRKNSHDRNSQNGLPHQNGHLSNNGKWVSPAEVWNMQDWQWKSLQQGEGVLHRRKIRGAMAPEVAAALAASKVKEHSAERRQSGSSEVSTSTTTGSTSIVGWLFGSNSSASINGSHHSPQSDTHKNLSSNPNSKSPIKSNPTRPLSGEINFHLSSSTSKYSFPVLQWDLTNLQPIKEKRQFIFQASERLARHMMIAESILLEQFPGLRINLSHPLGLCPGHHDRPCTRNKPLSIEDIYAGWDVGNPNKYTTTCISCGKEFVPRFTVNSSRADWTGSNGPQTPLWCEWLSPWTLRKELFNVIFAEGVEILLSADFWNPNISSQHAVLFWNTVVSFRLFGLPYSFLLCGIKLTTAFPRRVKGEFP